MVAASQSTASQLTTVATALIDEWEHNPRRTFDEKKLDSLGENMLKTGQIQPLLAREHPTKPGRLQLADGARRLRALKLKQIANAEVRVRALTDEQMLAIALSTGGDGGSEPLTPMDEARGYAEAKEIFKTSERGVAERLGKPVWLVQQRLALLELPEASMKAVTTGDLPATTAWLIARVPGKDKRAEAEQGVLHGNVDGGVMPYAVAKKFIEGKICRTMKGAPFDLEDATLAPESGKCSGCKFRSSNDRETYGDVRDDKCMNPSCYEAKVLAARARLLAREAVNGKEPLPKEVNDATFPPAEKGLSYRSEYAAWTQPITRDLLKSEVTRVPTWEGLLARGQKSDDGSEAPAVKVYVGIDQEGRAVDVVKLAEALAAVPSDEAAIFSEDVVRKHGLKLAKTRAESQESRVEEEKKELLLREKAERAAKKRHKKSREWLDELTGCLEGLAVSGQPAWGGYAYWSLMFELMLKALGDEDVAFVCELFGVDAEINAATDWTPRKVLTEFVGRISKDRCGVLVTAMTIAPWLRAEGPDAPFVTQWHDAFVAETPEGSEAEPNAERSTPNAERPSDEPVRVSAIDFSDTAVEDARLVKIEHEHANVIDVFRGAVKVARLSGPQRFIDELLAEWGKTGGQITAQMGQKFMVEVEDSLEDRARLTQLVRAFDGGNGMSAQRCAAEFKMTIEEVCGALELDLRTVRNVVTQLRQDVEEAFATAKLATAATRNRMVKTATSGRVKDFGDVAWPEDFRALLRMLSAKAVAKSEKAEGAE